MSTPEICCRTCAYWQPPDGAQIPSYGFANDKPHGQCRRMAPTIVVTPQGWRSYWPTMLGSQWCGEHGAVERTEVGR